MPIALPLVIACLAPRAIDGDTIRCANLSPAVRLAGIDAPELPGHCRAATPTRPARTCAPGDPFAARATLARLLSAGPVTLTAGGHDRYRRMLARAQTAAGDASCTLLATGAAIPRYARIWC